MRLVIEMGGETIEIKGLTHQVVVEHLKEQNQAVGERCAVLEEENAQQAERIAVLDSQLENSREITSSANGYWTLSEKLKEKNKRKRKRIKNLKGLLRESNDRVSQLEEENEIIEQREKSSRSHSLNLDQQRLEAIAAHNGALETICNLEAELEKEKQLNAELTEAIDGSAHQVLTTHLQQKADDATAEASKWKAEAAKWEGIAQGREKTINELEGELEVCKQKREQAESNLQLANQSTTRATNSWQEWKRRATKAETRVEAIGKDKERLEVQVATLKAEVKTMEGHRDHEVDKRKLATDKVVELEAELEVVNKGRNNANDSWRHWKDEASKLKDEKRKLEAEIKAMNESRRGITYHPKTNTYSNTKGIGNRTGDDDGDADDTNGGRTAHPE